MLTWLLGVLSLLPIKQWYIKHTEGYLYGYRRETQYFGPFFKVELKKRLNDPMADFLATNADEIEAVKLSKQEVREAGYISGRAWWLEQANQHKEY